MPAPAVFLLILLICTTTEAANLKVGLYNEIPDVGRDCLTSYKTMVEANFNLEYPLHTVDAIVDSSLYDPYGDLTKYIQEDKYDLLEIDTISLPDLVNDGLVVPLDEILAVVSMEDILSAAVEAIKVNQTIYAYPTLVCGNFIIGLAPGNDQNCDIRGARSDFEAFYNEVTRCQELLDIYKSYERLFGGKMDDSYGYYLPSLYIDGYIDQFGPGAAEEAINEVIQGEFDATLCENLSWFIDVCNDNCKKNSEENKCYHEYPGSYVQCKTSLYGDIAVDKTMFYFGFSENLATIIQQNPDIAPYFAVSGPLGTQNYLLMFTDALVVSSKSWQDEGKQQAIIDFINYFTDKDLRTAITLGMDLSPALPSRKRYLLQANRLVYQAEGVADDQIYQDILFSLISAVPIPYMTEGQRLEMEQQLRMGCVSLSSAE